MELFHRGLEEKFIRPLLDPAEQKLSMICIMTTATALCGRAVYAFVISSSSLAALLSQAIETSFGSLQHGHRRLQLKTRHRTQLKALLMPWIQARSATGLV
jgi:hypothetical protein